MKLPKEINTVTPFSKLVALILFISLPIMFFFMGMRYESNRQISINSTVFLSPVSPISKTGDWKSYASTSTGLSFLYPSDFAQIREGLNAQDSSCHYIEIFSNDKVDSSADANELSLSINICPAEIGSALETLYKENTNAISIQVSNKILTEYNGIPALKYQWRNNDGSGAGEVVLMILNNQKVIVYKSPISTSRENEYQRILSSFTIANTPKVLPTASILKLQVCPEHWVDNQMPCMSDEMGNGCENRQYFIVNGENKKFGEVDVAWVKQHCAITPEVVQ